MITAFLYMRILVLMLPGWGGQAPLPPKTLDLARHRLARLLAQAPWALRRHGDSCGFHAAWAPPFAGARVSVVTGTYVRYVAMWVCAILGLPGRSVSCDTLPPATRGEDRLSSLLSLRPCARRR